MSNSDDWYFWHKGERLGSIRLFNALHGLGIESLAEFMAITRDQLLQLNGVGPVNADEAVAIQDRIHAERKTIKPRKLSPRGSVL